jgi:hypothetical protein
MRKRTIHSYWTYFSTQTRSVMFLNIKIRCSRIHFRTLSFITATHLKNKAHTLLKQKQILSMALTQALRLRIQLYSWWSSLQIRLDPCSTIRLTNIKMNTNEAKISDLYMRSKKRWKGSISGLGQSRINLKRDAIKRENRNRTTAMAHVAELGAEVRQTVKACTHHGRHNGCWLM